MQYIRVKNLERYQHYKGRRPPWIKLYYCILQDDRLSNLTDASKLHIIAIMLLASQYENKIPFKKNWISSIIAAKSRINWDSILSTGIIECVQDASMPLADSKQLSIVETEKSRYREEKTPYSPPKGDEVSIADFERFWQIYPRKVGKVKARAAWVRLKPDINVVLTSLKIWITSDQWVRDNGQYIPHPTTWLNRNGWEDQISKPLTWEQRYGYEQDGSEIREKFDDCIPDS